MTPEREELFFKKIQPDILNGFVSCKTLLSAAKSTGITGEGAQRIADKRKIRINKCQLGFFGWENTDALSFTSSEKLKKCIRTASVDNTVTCRALWNCADSCDSSRRETGAAVDGLGFKVKGCQLGIF